MVPVLIPEGHWAPQLLIDTYYNFYSGECPDPDPYWENDLKCIFYSDAEWNRKRDSFSDLVVGCAQVRVNFEKFELEPWMIPHSTQNHRLAYENIRNYIRKMYISRFIGEKPVRHEVGQKVSQVDDFHAEEGVISKKWRDR